MLGTKGEGGTETMGSTGACVNTTTERETVRQMSMYMRKKGEAREGV